LIYSTLTCSLALAASQSNGRSVSATFASDIPHLLKQGTVTQLIVHGKPFLALAGELLNNSATSLEYMKPVWAKLVETKLNSVVAGVSWAPWPRAGPVRILVLTGLRLFSKGEL